MPTSASNEFSGHLEGEMYRWLWGGQRSEVEDGKVLPHRWAGPALVREREHLRGFVLCSFCLYCGNVGGTLQISLGFFLFGVCMCCLCMYVLCTDV